MPLSNLPPLDELSRLVRHVGVGAFGGDKPQKGVSIKRDGSFVTALDHQIQDEIARLLDERWPEIPLLGEEMSDAERDRILHASHHRFWCLDPLDGTTNYASGLPIYGVSLALIQDGAPVLAVVYDPNRDECFAARAGSGATLNGRPLHTVGDSVTRHCIACVDFKRLARTLAEHLVAQPPYKSQRNLGACVLEWCWLAANRFQLYLHGGQKLWDYAAGSLILREAGGRAVTLEGTEIPDPESGQFMSRKISVVAASNPTLLEDWWSWISERADLYNLLMKSDSFA